MYGQKKLFAVDLSLKYLKPQEDFLSILLVNTNWKKMLHNKINRLYLISPYQNPNLKNYRKMFWL